MAKGGKMKTHKADAKVFKVKKNGTLSYKKSNGNHMTNKDTAKQVRQRRNKGVLSKGMADNIKSVIK